nr:unnamed protein product [Callosobruchus chinensis]
MSDIEQPDSYEIVTDEHVIALIQAVSQYPEIYDPRNKYHKHQDTLYSVWKEVGRDLYLVNVRVSGLYCKLKWGTIRKQYVAYLKKKSQGSQPKNKYADYLYWLDPYIGLINQRGSRKSKGLEGLNPKKVSRVEAAKSSDARKTRGLRDSNDPINGNPKRASRVEVAKSSDDRKTRGPRKSRRLRESRDMKNSDPKKVSKAAKSSNAKKPCNAETFSDQPHPRILMIEDNPFEKKFHLGDTGSSSSSNTGLRNNIEQNAERQDLKIEAVDFSDELQRSQDYSQAGEKDPDMLFLESILPDLRKMSDRQKNGFKLKTMQLISDILYPTPKL